MLEEFKFIRSHTVRLLSEEGTKSPVIPGHRLPGPCEISAAVSSTSHHCDSAVTFTVIQQERLAVTVQHVDAHCRKKKKERNHLITCNIYNSRQSSLVIYGAISGDLNDNQMSNVEYISSRYLRRLPSTSLLTLISADMLNRDLLGWSH